jgi:hypothetical protein
LGDLDLYAVSAPAWLPAMGSEDLGFNEIAWGEYPGARPDFYSLQPIVFA